MPQSLAKVYVHLIFSTKHGEPIITDEARPKLHSYLGDILRTGNATSLEITTEPDHGHTLFLLPRTHALSDVLVSKSVVCPHGCKARISDPSAF